MTVMPSEKRVIPLEEKRSEDKPPADLAQRLMDVQNLLFGDAQREIVDRLNHADDRHAEHAKSTAEQIAQLSDALDKKIEALRQEIRAIDRAQTAKRRKLVSDLGEAIKAMSYDA